MTVTPPPSVGTAIIALFSMYSCSWWPTRYSPSRTRSAAAKAASTSPRLDARTSANTWSRASGSKTGGSCVVRGVARLAGLAQGRPVGRGEQRQRLGVVLDLAADRDEDRLVALDRADDVLAGDVGRGDDDDLRPVERRIELERVEGGVRVGRADRRAVPGARARRCRRCRARCRSAWPGPRDAAGAAGRARPGTSCRAG